MFMQQVKDYQNRLECVCSKRNTIKIMLNVYVVGKALSKPCEMCIQNVKNYQNQAICLCSSEKTINSMLNVYVVGKKDEK